MFLGVVLQALMNSPAVREMFLLRASGLTNLIVATDAPPSLAGDADGVESAEVSGDEPWCGAGDLGGYVGPGVSEASDSAGGVVEGEES